MLRIIAPVATHPRMVRTGGRVNPPMMSRRCVISIMVTMTGPATIPLITALTKSVDLELAGVAARLRFGRVTRRHEPLRDRHRALLNAVTRAADAGGRLDPASALVVAETDELVDATNSLNAVLDTSQRAPGASRESANREASATTARSKNSRQA